MKEDKDKEKEKDNFISLKFIVNGKTFTDDKVNIHQPLKVAVEKALKETGNTGRPLSDWIIKLNDNDLDINKKIGDFNFPKDALIIISLKAGIGGK